MPPALSARMAGLPRWAWLLILTSGLVMGLFIRKRSLENTAAGVDPETEGDATGDPVPLEYGDASFGASVIPAGGAGGLTPVESPILPPGYAESFTALTTALSELAINRDNARADTQVAAIQNPAPTSPTSVATGGGPPSMVPSRLAVVPKHPAVKPGPKHPPVTQYHYNKKKKRMEYYWNGNWHTARPDGTGATSKDLGSGGHS